MKKIFLGLAAIAAIGSLSSCKDFLVEEPVLKQSNELTLSTYEGLNSAGAALCYFFQSADWYDGQFILQSELRAGNAKNPKSEPGSGRYRIDTQWNYTAESTSALWAYAYYTISWANNIINNLEGKVSSEVTQQQVDNLMAEALFIRALCHFDLVITYAQPYTVQPNSLGVPVILVTENGLPARNTVKEVFDQVVADLLEAERLISADYTRSGCDDPAAVVSKSAIQALLSRVYLYMGEWQKAANYAIKNGRTKEDVQKEWKLNNLKSTISGTRTPLFGESYTNLICGYPELICEENRPQYIKEYNTLVSTYPKEDAVKKFYDELEKNLHPVGAEFKLSTKYMDGVRKICGTCDLLFYDSDKDGFVIGDWKTNKSLIKEYNRTNGIMMRFCLSNYYDEPLSHYRVQFNIYQAMLESIGIKIIDRILVWLKDDGTYEKLYIDKIPDDKIGRILKGEA